MRFSMSQDMKIVRGHKKYEINFLAYKVGVTPEQLQKRIDYLYSEEGKGTLRSVYGAMKRHVSDMKNLRERQRLDFMLLSPPTVPIETQHIDTDYIKGTFQAKYIKMRQRERRANDTARDIFIST